MEWHPAKSSFFTRNRRQNGRVALPLLLLVIAGLTWFFSANCGQTILVNPPPKRQDSLWSRVFHWPHRVGADVDLRKKLTPLRSSAPMPASASSPTSSLVIRGAGSSFALPLFDVWKSALARINPDVRIDYDSNGSETGLADILSGKIDFALTEVPLTPNQLSEAKTPLEQFPVAAGPVCLVYNLPNLVFPLKLTPQTLAAIYLGEVTEWNDELIRRDNPNVELPHTTILTVHRAKPSGTTSIFTHYLADVSKQWDEEASAGEQIEWPAQGRSGVENEGVAQAVTHVDGGIGYVECAYAAQNKLPIARLQNQSGHFVDPDAASVSAAVRSFAPQLAQNPFALPVNSPDPAAYPIIGVSYIVFPQAVMKSRNLQPLLGFLDWAFDQGQRLAPTVNFAPLPDDLLQKQRKLLDQNPEVPLSAELLLGVRPDQDRSVLLPEPKKLPKRRTPDEPERHDVGKSGL